MRWWYYLYLCDIGYYLCMFQFRLITPVQKSYKDKMDPQQSSATASADPDLVSIQYFEKGGANPQKEPIVVVILYRSFPFISYHNIFLL